MEGITFNLGLGTSPFEVTIADASGLAPLELPRAFAVDRQPPRPPSDDAVCRFEAALSAGAAPADAKQAIQIIICRACYGQNVFGIILPSDSLHRKTCFRN